GVRIATARAGVPCRIALGTERVPRAAHAHHARGADGTVAVEATHLDLVPVAVEAERAGLVTALEPPRFAATPGRHRQTAQAKTGPGAQAPGPVQPAADAVLTSCRPATGRTPRPAGAS